VFETLSLALALAMDAAAVSAGIAAGQRAWRPVAAAAVSFGIFQGLMSGIGWWGGAWLTARAAAWDHWIAFVLLVGLGGRMAWHALGEEDDDAPRAALTLPTLLTLSIATSIDALAAGVSLPLLPLPGPASAAIIGVVTLLCCALAGAFGRALSRLGPRLEVAGGVVLVLIGVKVLVEHLTAG
jgi:putative Mn2+ efflux pump MntP